MKCMWNLGCLASRSLDRWGLVSAVVVTDQVHVQLGGHGLVDRDEELLELGGAVLAVQLADHRAVSDIERGEQAGDAVAGVVVRAPFGHVVSAFFVVGVIEPAESRCSNSCRRVRRRPSSADVGGLQV